ncbi:MAG: LamG domain-containing protein, partial [Nanoarchaeota archaeon]
MVSGAPDINFTNPTPSSGLQSSNSIYVNLSTNSSLDHYAFVNFYDSLVLWMRMDEVNGSGDPVDLSRYSNNGTLDGDVFINSSGYWGNASWFDGDSDYITIPHSSAISLQENITWSFWIKPTIDYDDVADTYNLIKKVTASDGYSMNINGWSGQRIQVRMSNGTDGDSSFQSDALDWDANTWYHVAITFDNSSLVGNFYRNGASIGNDTVNLDFVVSSTADLLLGWGVNTEYNGSMDEVLIFNRSLNAAEIAALYNASASKYENNFTSLADGAYTFTGYAVDTPGDRNETEERTVTIQGDLIYPIFSAYWDNNATLLDSGVGEFNVTVQNTNGTVLLEINGENVTATNLTASVYNVSYTFSSSGSYTYRWHSWGNGTSENYNVSADRTYTVNTSDVEYPLFSNYGGTANNSAYSSGAGYVFNITISSTNGTVGFEFNGVNYTASNSSDVFNVTVSNLAAGIYSYYWWAYGNGTSENYNISETLSYTVARATSEVNLTLNGTQDNLTTDAGVVWLNVSLVSGDTGGVLSLYNNGTLINYGTGNLSNATVFGTTGLYNITAVFNQSQNYSLSSVTYWVNVSNDSFAPQVVINSPTATTYTTSGYAINITLNEGGYCEYSLDGGVTNSTLTNVSDMEYYGTQSGVSNGNYVLYAYCNDSLGNVNYTENVSFSVSVSSGEDPGSGGGGGGGTTGFWKNTFVFDDEEFNIKKSIQKALRERERVRVKIDSERHYVGVVELTDVFVKVNVSSTPQQATLYVGNEKKFDVTDDGFYDLIVTLNG